VVQTYHSPIYLTLILTYSLGDVLFTVKYQAVVFRPFKGEVLDGVVHTISKEGLFINIGPLDGFVSKSVSLYLALYFPF
jgi:DNA-directed RNA polymerase subunit E'/Rpb7